MTLAAINTFSNKSYTAIFHPIFSWSHNCNLSGLSLDGIRIHFMLSGLISPLVHLSQRYPLFFFFFFFKLRPFCQTLKVRTNTSAESLKVWTDLIWRVARQLLEIFKHSCPFWIKWTFIWSGMYSRQQCCSPAFGALSWRLSFRRCQCLFVPTVAVESSPILHRSQCFICHSLLITVCTSALTELWRDSPHQQTFKAASLLLYL